MGFLLESKRPEGFLVNTDTYHFNVVTVYPSTADFASRQGISHCITDQNCFVWRIAMENIIRFSLVSPKHEPSFGRENSPTMDMTLRGRFAPRQQYPGKRDPQD
ncbi:hypothetical protein T265_15696, partial [Opisthorchis viverrini]